MRRDEHLCGVVVHLDESGGAKQQSVLRNLCNLLDDLDEETPVELVVHGAGIELCLLDGPLVEELEALIERGVVIAACENTLRTQGLDRNQLAAGVVTVPAGIGELVRKQHQGWAYVRP